MVSHFLDSECATNGKGERRAVVAIAVFVSLVGFAVSGREPYVGLQSSMWEDEGIGGATTDSVLWGYDVLVLAPEPCGHRSGGSLLVRGIGKGEVGIWVAAAFLAAGPS